MNLECIGPKLRLGRPMQPERSSGVSRWTPFRFKGNILFHSPGSNVIVDHAPGRDARIHIEMGNGKMRIMESGYRRALFPEERALSYNSSNNYYHGEIWKSLLTTIRV